MNKEGLRKVILGGMICLLTAGAALSLSPPARAQLEVDENDMVSIDFDNIDIRVVIKYISDLTGKNFIVDNDVRGTVTVISPTKIPIAELYKVFESILEVRGFVAVPSGKVIKVSTKRKGSQKNIRMEVGDNVEQIVPEDTIITQLIPLRYASVEKIRNALGQLFSKDASVIPYPTINILIVTDISSNIRRLVKIIHELDVPGYETKITVLPLRYAAAETMAAEIMQVIEQAGELPGGPPTPRRRRKPAIQPSEKMIKIIPDERTNSLIILANDEDSQRTINLVKRLDVETERTRIHVYFLKNSNAEDMAKVLGSIVSKRKPKGKEMVPLISEDKPTNSLIIDATQEDYADLTKIINKLDVVRDQVLVEVLIAEVSYEKTFELGVEWKSVGNNGTANNGYPTFDNIKPGRSGAQGFGGSTWSSGGLTNYLTSSDGPVSAGAGLSLGFVQKIAGAGSSIPDFAVLLHALQTNKDVNVLATPQVLTIDNEEASIKVGQNIPYMTKYEVGTSGSNSAQNIDYKDIGIDLKITPHISKDRMVRLENEISVTNYSGQQVSGVALIPTTTIREAKNSVLVKDNHTIVIGGMIMDNKNKTVDKIPILGDIPLLGVLFQTKSTKKEKINLLIFITPRVVKTTQQVADLTKFKRRQMKEIDKRMTEVEDETAAAEYEYRARERAKIKGLISRTGKVYSGSPAGAEPGPAAEVESPPLAGAEMNPPAPAPSSAEKVKETFSGSLLENLLKVSFTKKDEEKKGTKAQKRGRKP